MLLKKKGLLHCEETQLWGVANEQQNTRINHHYSYTTDANISNHRFKFLREATEKYYYHSSVAELCLPQLPTPHDWVS